MSNTAVVPSAPGPGPGPSGGPGGGTEVIQVTNVSPSASSEQMRTLFGFLGKIDELRLFPPDDSPLPVSSRVCFVKFHDPDSAVVAQHLTNTVFVDRALIVVPYAEGLCFVSLPMWAPLPGHWPQSRCRVSITRWSDSKHYFVNPCYTALHNYYLEIFCLILKLRSKFYLFYKIINCYL